MSRRSQTLEPDCRDRGGEEPNGNSRLFAGISPEHLNSKTHNDSITPPVPFFYPVVLAKLDSGYSFGKVTWHALRGERERDRVDGAIHVRGTLGSWRRTCLIGAGDHDGTTTMAHMWEPSPSKNRLPGIHPYHGPEPFDHFEASPAHCGPTWNPQAADDGQRCCMKVK